MTRSALFSGKYLAIGATIIALGVVAGLWMRAQVRESLLDELRADAVRCALVFRQEELGALAGNRGDLSSPAYLAVKERLKQLRAVHPKVRFVYIFRYLPGRNEVIYLADSEREQARELSLPGDVFPEAATMPGLQAIFANATPAVEGPIKDSFGVFVTGYAPIGDWREAGGVKEVVGLDVTAESWRRDLLEAGMRGAIYVWLCLGLPFAAYLWGRMRAAQVVMINKLATAVEESRSAIMIMSAGGVIEYANAGLCQQTGYARHEIVGRNWRDFGGDEMAEGAIEEVMTRIKAGYSWQGDWVQKRRDGGAYPVRGTVSPVHGSGTTQLGFIAVLNDSSDQLMQEAALRVERDKAEHADRAKGAFLATMGHEVRTPLNGIVGCANLLLDTPLSDEQREYLHTIRTSSRALMQLTGDILDYSRLESGSLSLAETPCDICTVVEDVIDVFAPKAAGQGLELLHTIEAGVPAQVVVDAGRLRQILINLIGNAVKFTPAGRIAVNVRLVTERAPSLSPFERELMGSQGQLLAEFDDGTRVLEFSIQDTGIGIADEDRPRLFQAFTQIDSSNARRYGGAGLGLVISRNLVRLMGGEIWLESRPGHGSVFRFTIRCRPALDMAALLPPLRLEGARVAILTASSYLGRELETLIRDAGGVPVKLGLAGIATSEGMITVIECDEEFMTRREELMASMRWTAGLMVGLVPISMPTGERQKLRWHFRMLINKPVHHRALLEILTKMTAGERTHSASPIV